MWLFSNNNNKSSWPQFTAEEVRLHNTAHSLWIISDCSVYDVTEMLETHPGGSAAVQRYAGGVKDCLVDFFFHSACARKLWESHKIGEITESEKQKLLKAPPATYQADKRASSSLEEEPPAAGEEGGGERRRPAAATPMIANANHASHDLDDLVRGGEKEISFESLFLNSPDWIVYNRRNTTVEYGGGEAPPPHHRCCCRSYLM